MIKLNARSLADMPSDVATFAYDRSALKPGIVHLGVGNYHRAHQARHTHNLLALTGDTAWGLCGVGIQDTPVEREKSQAFKSQDQLYTLRRFAPDSSSTCQIIGSIVKYLHAPDELEAVLAQLAAPETKIVTMTITEAGYNQDRLTGAYCLDTDEVQADLSNPRAPKTVFGILVETLRLRRAATLPPFTIMSCDNLNENGVVARNAVVSHARALDRDLAQWIEDNVAFPSSMVDGITPSVGQKERDRLNATSGIDDALPVFSETHMDWIIENQFCGPRPEWEKVGVRFVDDVRPYEHAKLHLLNASHSMCAYPGILAGLEFIHEALAEPLIRELLDQYMEYDVKPILQAATGLDPQAYKEQVLARFSCSAIADQLARVCGGGVVKLPVFIGPVLQKAMASGRDIRRMVFGIACFLQYLRGIKDDGARFAPGETMLTEKDHALIASTRLEDLVGISVITDMGVPDDSPAMAMIVEIHAEIVKFGSLETLRKILATSR